MRDTKPLSESLASHTQEMEVGLPGKNSISFVVISLGKCNKGGTQDKKTIFKHHYFVGSMLFSIPSEHLRI
jgi:hypothetical protein